jgi:hypothetical protein
VPVSIIGVRHHSPACARVVAHAIEIERPRHVLIEGPSTINDRMAELALGHALPIALYSFAAGPLGHRASFYPFADYSPEWVALESAREHGARTRFIDLPPEHSAFAERENHYDDRDLQRSRRSIALAARLGFDNVDSLWDHLFEQPAEPAELRLRLERYFESLRGDDDASEGDAAREEFMARFIAHVHATDPGAGVLVVCGGWHAPVLARRWPVAPAEPPDPRAFSGLEPEGPPDREGIYLVPFSFRRLEALGGYASGMPSPGFYQAVWEEGPRSGAARMFERAVRTLRGRKQAVSVADSIAASTLVESLRRLRDHACPLRTDVLDGLASTLVDDALDVPLPWSRRDVLSPRTHPKVAVLVAAFTGDGHGKLAAGTPRPPLVDDARSEIERVGVSPSPGTREVVAPLDEPSGRARSHVLHRLRLLSVPGVRLEEGRSFQRGESRLAERWRVTFGTGFDPALIEAAIFGPTLEDASRGALESRADPHAGAAALSEILFEANLAGLATLSDRTLDRLHDGLLAEPDIKQIGVALGRLVWLARDPASMVERAQLQRVLISAVRRTAWLLEGLAGADAPPSREDVDAVVALRDAAHFLGAELGPELTTIGELAVRRANDATAPLHLRGACLGLAAALVPELGAAAIAPDALIRAIRGVPRAERIGDFLLGLFALAREPLRDDDALLAAIDHALQDLSPVAFQIALPSLRQAFGYFPPRERLELAERLVREAKIDPASLVAPVDTTAAAEGLRRDRIAAELFARFGLGGEGRS